MKAFTLVILLCVGVWQSGGNFDTSSNELFKAGGLSKEYFREKHCFMKKGCRNMGV
jgi:hypothetical protein